MNDTIEAVFAGADDSETCDGCNDAMDGNPYDISDCPEPGSFECMSRCRHIIQITSDSTGDYETMDWSSTNGFTVSDEAAATDDYYGGTKFDDAGHEVPDDEEPDVSDEDITDLPVTDEGAPVSDLDLTDVLDLGDSDALDSYVDDNGLADLKDQASAGFSDHSQAYYLAEALQKAEPGAGWKVQFDGQWYVTNDSNRLKESIREGGEGSGNHGHAGRKNIVGGSAEGDGHETYIKGAHQTVNQIADYMRANGLSDGIIAVRAPLRYEAQSSVRKARAAQAKAEKAAGKATVPIVPKPEAVVVKDQTPSLLTQTQVHENTDVRNIAGVWHLSPQPCDEATHAVIDSKMTEVAAAFPKLNDLVATTVYGNVVQNDGPEDKNYGAMTIDLMGNKAAVVFNSKYSVADFDRPQTYNVSRLFGSPEERYAQNVTHELGHVLHLNLDLPARKEWRAVAATALTGRAKGVTERRISKYATQNPNELFAESFVMHYEGLGKSLPPQINEFMTTHLPKKAE